MLFDLTRICKQRVDQVDELQIAGRLWIRNNDLLLLIAGAAVARPAPNRSCCWVRDSSHG